MPFASIPKQPQVVRLLQNALRRDTLAHAYIFNGPQGTGRKQTAEILAQALYCTELPDDACGECLACRTIAHRNHPDIHWIEPDGVNIKIDQIRELQRKFAYRSNHSGAKVYVLNEAERLNIQAANCLLKFLEEPTSKVVAILITDNGQALLPTIRSRAQWLNFLPMNPEWMLETLKNEGQPEALASSAVHLAAGLGAARELIQSNWFAETRNVMIQLAKETLTKLPDALLTIQNKVVKGEPAGHLMHLLDLWILWFKDLVRIKAGLNERIVYIDQSEWLRKQSAMRETEDWVYCMERLLELRKRLRYFANPQLGLENAAIEIQRGKL
jgi:DNA polymerase-3 subunit delta'